MKRMNLTCAHCKTATPAVERSFSGGMARTLVALCRIYQASGGQWVDAKTHNLSKTDLDKLTTWGLVQSAPLSGRQKRPASFVPTAAGWNFAAGQGTTPVAAVMNEGTSLGFFEKQVGIRDVLKNVPLESLWAGTST